MASRPGRAATAARSSGSLRVDEGARCDEDVRAVELVDGEFVHAGVVEDALM